MMALVCPFCGREFSNIGGLVRHVKEQHYDMLVYGNTCLVCRRPFKSYRGLVNHLVRMARKGDCTHLLAYYIVTRRFNKNKNGWATGEILKCFQA